MHNVNKLAARWAGCLASFGVVATALAGCSMGGFAAKPDPSTQFANANATPAEIAQVANNTLPAIATACPPIKVRPGGEALFAYQGGKTGNPQSVRYQAVIDEQTRNCVASNGLITVKMGVNGRVLLGPVGSEQQVTVPLRFAVERDGVALFSEKYSIPVAIDPALQTGHFTKVLENVAIPYIGGEDIVIWVGFDGR